MLPSLAIFDHDGVLVDTLGFHLESWLELGRREGLPITEAFVRETFGRTNADILEILLDGSCGGETVTRLGDLKESCYRDIARDRLVLMNGVRDLLDTLTAAGIGLAIGSSGPRANLDLTIETCHLGGRFKAIVGREDFRQGKPDPEVFLVAAHRCGVTPGSCVVFEDAPFGIEAAKAAGMIAVGVGTTHPLPHLLDAGADEVVPDLVGFDPRTLLH